MVKNGMLSVWTLFCSIWGTVREYLQETLYIIPKVHFTLPHCVAINISGEKTTSSRSGYQSAFSNHGHPICFTLLIQRWKSPSKFDSVKGRRGLSVASGRKAYLLLRQNTLDESGLLEPWLVLQPSKTTRGRIQTKKIEPRELP